MRYKHVIWDWNGTLLDDVWLCVEVVNGLLAGRNLPCICAQSYRDHFDFPVYRFYQWLGLEHQGEAFDKISEEFITAYDQRRFECGLQPCVTEALEYFYAGGAVQVILSAYRQHTLGEVVRHYGLEAHFSQVIGTDNYLAAGKLDLGRRHFDSIPHGPHEVLLIGDTTHDFEVARAMGADCILLDHGHQNSARLHACGVPVYASLEALLDKGLPGG